MDEFYLSIIGITTTAITITGAVALYLYFFSYSIPSEVIFVATDVMSSSAQCLSDNFENVMIPLEHQIDIETGISEDIISKNIEQYIEYSPIIVGEPNGTELTEKEIDSILSFDTFDQDLKNIHKTNPIEGEKGETIKGFGKKDDIRNVKDEMSLIKKHFNSLIYSCTFTRTRLWIENFNNIPSSGFVAFYKKYMLLIDNIASDLASIPLAIIGGCIIFRNDFEMITDFIGQKAMIEPLKFLVSSFESFIKDIKVLAISYQIIKELMIEVYNKVTSVTLFPFKWTRAEWKIGALFIIVAWNYVILTNPNAAYFFTPAPLHIYLADLHLAVFDFLYLELGWNRLAFWWFNLPISSLDIIIEDYLEHIKNQIFNGFEYITNIENITNIAWNTVQQVNEVMIEVGKVTVQVIRGFISRFF